MTVITPANFSEHESGNFLPRSDIANVKQKVFFYLKVHRYEAAEKIIKDTLLEHGHISVLYNMLGLTYHQQSRFPDALEQFAKALKSNHNFIEAAMNQIITLCDLSRYEEAGELFAKVGELSTAQNGVPVLIQGRIANKHAEIGELYEKNGFLAESIIEYKKALSLFPRMPDVKLAVAKIFFKTGQFEDAKIEIEDLLNIVSDHTDALNLLGLIYYKIGQSEMAGHHWRTVNKIDSDNQVAQAYLKILDNQGNEF